MLVGILGVGQIFLYNRCDLFSIMLDGLFADVVQVVQTGVVVVDVCHSRKIDARYGVLHDGEIGSVRHFLIDHIG